MPIYKNPSRSSTVDSQDTLSSTGSSNGTTETVAVQTLDARFANPEKLAPRLDVIFNGQNYGLELQRGQWRITGAPRLSKEDISSLHL